MVGCVARAVDECIIVDADEMDDARWFSRAQLLRAVERSTAAEGWSKIVAAADAGAAGACMLARLRALFKRRASWLYGSLPLSVG